jgi:ubiquinone/menaquinone biosynthesis C-methylase UbiE
MKKESKDVMINPQLLSDKAYRDTSKLDKRKDLYLYTFPYYNIEDEVLKLQSLADGGKMLDIGCGTGKLLLKAAVLQPKAHLVGVDISEGMYKTAQLESKQKGLDIDFQTGDIQNLPFPNSSFDKITAMHMIYHAPDIHLALGELARVIKQDGLVVITANSGESRKQLGLLKSQAGKIMRREVFMDPNARFNIEEGFKMVSEYFKNVSLIPFESTLRLTSSQPYVDYINSLREFWQPLPTDRQWNAVLKFTREYVETEILSKGEFTDKVGFGAILASHSPISSEIFRSTTK